jgi:hypothetical protein
MFPKYIQRASAVSSRTPTVWRGALARCCRQPLSRLITRLQHVISVRPPHLTQQPLDFTPRTIIARSGVFMKMSNQTSHVTTVQRGMGTAPPFNFSRRYACDRCRDHKLRCIRDHMSADNPCQRCRKARQKCSIGSSTRHTTNQGRINRLSLGDKLPDAISLMPPTPPTTMPRQQTRATSLGETEQSDTLQLSSAMPWLDIFDSTMLDSACDGAYDLNFTGAGSANGETTNDNDTSTISRIHTIMPTNQRTTIMASPFLSSHADFDLSPSFGTFGNQSSSGFDRAYADVQVDAQQPYDSTCDSSSSRASSNEHAKDCRSHMSLLDFINRPAASSYLPASTSPHRTHSTISSIDSNKLILDQKQACVQELNELSVSLTKDLHSVISCKLASSFLFTRSNKSPAEYFFKSLDGYESKESAIGRMLQGSEKFLEIMQRFNEPPHSTPPLPQKSLYGDASDASSVAKALDVLEDDIEAQLSRRWGLLQSYLERRDAAPNVTSFGTWLGDNLTPGLSRRPDITSKVAVLTCYTCLLWIYETVFFVIHHTLECSPSLASTIKLPQTVPGLQINGFMLQNHPSLQTRILIQVSAHMLDSIEKALKDMLSDSTFQALLTTVLQKEGLQYSPGDETGESISCNSDIYIWRLTICWQRHGVGAQLDGEGEETVGMKYCLYICFPKRVLNKRTPPRVEHRHQFVSARSMDSQVGDGSRPVQEGSGRTILSRCTWCVCLQGIALT